MDTFLIALFIIVCILLIVVVLLQKGRGGGLGAAFGGLGSSAFGTRVGDVFTWVTIVLTAAFLLLAILTTMYFRPKEKTVQNPKLSPLPGRYTEDRLVTMRCPTPRSEIRYTMDGRDPTPDDALYIAPVRLKIAKKGVVLKARAFRSRWKPSEVVGGYYGPNPPPAPASRPSSQPGPPGR